MDPHETKARTKAQIDEARIKAQIEEWKKNLETMKAKAETATGQAKVGYLEDVGQLQEQLDDLKIRVARAWDAADGSWDSTRKDLELQWQEWERRAKRVWNELTK
jgi:hypothetical protein